MSTKRKRWFRFIPRDESFFDLFDDAAKNVLQCTLRLKELLDDFSDLEQKQKEIKRLEHAGDEITHTILERLNTTFLTPIDRDDIHRLATQLDDVIDLMDAAANRMKLYKIDEPTEDSRRLAGVLVECAKLIVEALEELKNSKFDAILRKCVEIHTQENEGDRIEQHALSALFEDGHSPIDIIKWKDIYEDLEDAIDRSEDVANILEAIVLKNA